MRSITIQAKVALAPTTGLPARFLSTRPKLVFITLLWCGSDNLREYRSVVELILLYGQALFGITLELRAVRRSFS